MVTNYLVKVRLGGADHAVHLPHRGVPEARGSRGLLRPRHGLHALLAESLNYVPADPFTAWLEALEKRHLGGLTFPEVRRALQALSSLYVERRDRLATGAALEGAGKRAAFALFYGPLHFLLVREIVRALGAARPRPPRVAGPRLRHGVGRRGVGARSASARPPRRGPQRLGRGRGALDASRARPAGLRAKGGRARRSEAGPADRGGRRLHRERVGGRRRAAPARLRAAAPRTPGRACSWWSRWLAAPWPGGTLGGRVHRARRPCGRVAVPRSALRPLSRSSTARRGSTTRELTGRSLWVPGQPRST